METKAASEQREWRKTGVANMGLNATTKKGYPAYFHKFWDTNINTDKYIFFCIGVAIQGK